MDDFKSLLEAPNSILGEPIVLLHFAGATEHVTLKSKDEALVAFYRGWTRFKYQPPPNEETEP